MFHGKWGLEEDWMPVKVFTFHPLYFPSGKSGPQYSPIPLIAHSSVLDLLSLRRLDLHTHKFWTTSRSLQTGNFVLSTLVLGSFMLEEWLRNMILEIVQLCQMAWCHHGAYMQLYSTVSIWACVGVGKIVNMTQRIKLAEKFSISQVRFAKAE